VIGGPMTTVCSSLTGIRYEADAGVGPPITALIAGVASAVTTAVATWWVMRRRRIHLG
jgi:hypothetical protein